jgi:outer membrane protein TolC
MKASMQRVCSLAVILVGCALLCSSAAAEPLPFRRAIELALQHGGPVAIAAAERTRAHEAYLELRNMYLPQVIVGSGLGATAGFPLSLEGAAPSVLNLTTQQFLFNPAQKDFIRAAKTEWDATTFNTTDRRNQVLLDTALAYIELDRLTAALNVLRQEEETAMRVEQIVRERVQAGVDSEVDMTRARLSSARVRMRMAELQGAADVRRTQLAFLTGLPAASIETVTESIPPLPQVAQHEDLVDRALSASPDVKLAESTAQARHFRARGEHKLLYPMIDLASQYALLSRFNNYEEFFRKFQRHNASVGVVIRFPFLNFSQRARAEAADAEAARAGHEADAARQKVATETLKLQRSIAQLSAAQEIARLEHQLAVTDVDATQARIEAGTASLRDKEAARVVEHEKYGTYLDAGMALDRAQLQLLRMTGELEKWAGTR